MHTDVYRVKTIVNRTSDFIPEIARGEYDLSDLPLRTVEAVC